MAIRNDSPEPWLDRIVTDAIRREMDARGGISLVNQPDNADLVMRGRVLPLQILSRSFSSFAAALEYSVTIELDLEILRSSGDIVHLDPLMLSDSEVYLASADIETTRTHKLEALRRLSDLLAGRIADSIEMMEAPIDRSSDVLESTDAADDTQDNTQEPPPADADAPAPAAPDVDDRVSQAEGDV